MIVTQTVPRIAAHLAQLAEQSLAIRKERGLPNPVDLPTVEAAMSPSPLLGEYYPGSNTIHINLFSVADKGTVLAANPYLHLAFEYLRAKPGVQHIGNILTDLDNARQATVTTLEHLAWNRIQSPAYSSRGGGPVPSPTRFVNSFESSLRRGGIEKELEQLAADSEQAAISPTYRGSQNPIIGTMDHEMHHAGYAEGLLAYTASNIRSKIAAFAPDSPIRDRTLRRAARQLPQKIVKMYLGSSIVDEAGAFFFSEVPRDKWGEFATNHRKVERTIASILRNSTTYFQQGVYEWHQENTIANAVNAHSLALRQEPSRIYDAVHNAANVHEFIEIAAGRMR